MVIHFAIDGGAYFVTVGCGASKWDSDRGDFSKYSDDEIKLKVDWAKNTLRKSGKDTSSFPDQISIGSSVPPPRAFEKATVFAKTLDPVSSTEEELIKYVSEALELLSVIYEAYSQRSDLTTSEASSMDLQAAISPNRAASGQRQGYGLTGAERKAVELQAMTITQARLEEMGYKVTDTSSSQSFDFLAQVNEEEIKVEVKGTTSNEVDSVLMTSNEVELHKREAGSTALAIVSGIKLTSRGSSAKCCGGDLELILPWDIRNWELSPKAFAVSRKTRE